MSRLLQVRARSDLSGSQIFRVVNRAFIKFAALSARVARLGRVKEIPFGTYRRHAAALALCGWYLMTPPMDAGHHIDTNAPLSRWQILSSFDNANDCAIVTQDLRDDKNAASWKRRRSMLAVCISTDDPRLKPK